MRIYYLAGVILSITTILSACGEGTPTECTISTPREIRQGVTKTGKFAPGTDCEAMRKLAEEGKPLPTIAEGTTTNTAPKAAATPVQEGFKTPFVAGQKTQELIATTDKQARVQELEKKIGADSKQSRDPFTSTIINPVPKLETLLAKPKVQPNLRPAIVVRTSNIKAIVVPPDTKLAEGAKVTGTIELSGTVYAIISAAEEPSARYVKAGQLISNGKVLVKRIDTNAEPPIVVLQQNGVEILRPVGASVVAETNNPQSATTPTPPSTPSLTIPPLTPAR
ncbi:hypothetical protein H6F42_06285 [Pseudanabaena sp. FACHB-1998]|uniref:hypothetical protein n=1 Tax=Pseudanabaena sp. FACHB-1998 TaxID=2692858 RepID=UPI0016811A64|nr:hypothetical protein [Pseudanabaena sp. FACHB-1998]MBD2176521.1 hypothetical protein [Pseudanabaena sp. FACHB-1998]